MIGERFGRLVVTSDSGKKTRGRHSIFLCVCDCGSTAEVCANNLKSGQSRSCGCLKSELASARLYKHGFGNKNRTYRIWSAMRSRCNNPKHSKYYIYGGRGITVCEEWSDFLVFLADMGEAPKGLSIGRINNDLGYSLNNCRWETVEQQARNKSTNRWIEYNGERLILSDWAKRKGVKSYVLTKRLARGWTEEETILGGRSK